MALLNKQVKVIVFHAEKQHVNELLIALNKNQWLHLFYTLFAANKFLFFSKNTFFQKRYFKSILNDKILSYPLLALVSRLLKSEYLKVKYTYKWFDYFVSLKIKQANPEIVIGYETCNFCTFAKTKKLNKITILDLAAIHHVEQTTFLKKEKSLENAYINEYKALAFEYTDYIFVLSSFAKESLLKNTNFAPDKIYMLNLGVNHVNFFPKLHYSVQPEFKVLFVGNAFYHKGIPLLMEVISDLVVYENFNIKLIIVGALSEKYFINQKFPVELISFVDHKKLADIYRSADLFAFPSLIDSWGLVVLEAMASGLPVLVSENTGAKDAVHQGGGFVLPIHDKECWKKKISYFYNNRDKVETFGKIAHKVSLQYTWENYHNQVVAAIEDIAIKEGLY